MATRPKQNFFLWGSWGPRTIKRPFLTQKVERKIKHTVIGESFIVALLDDGTLVAWGDDKDGCLGLGPESVSVAEPRTIGGIHGKVIDVQYGLKHLMCLTDGGEVYVW